METRIVEMNQANDNEELLQEAGLIIRNGGLVAFPTETVYGLGGDALNSTSARKIYEAKGRPSDNPLIVHIADIEKLSYIVEIITKEAEELIEEFWPGPLTLIFHKSNKVPLDTTGGLETVAVRMPNHLLARAFIRESGGYVAAPSANVSGRPSPTLAKYVIEDMQDKIDMIIDGGMVGIGLESTIVDLTGEIPIILRPGTITKEMLEDVIGPIIYDPTILLTQCGEIPKAPGMKYTHYAPKGKLTIIQGTPAQVSRRINELTKILTKEGERVGIIATDETAHEYGGTAIKSVGSRTDELAIARRLYQILREFDDENITVIFSESFQSGQLGHAIMNRLLKAAGYRLEEI